MDLGEMLLVAGVTTITADPPDEQGRTRIRFLPIPWLYRDFLYWGA